VTLCAEALQGDIALFSSRLGNERTAAFSDFRPQGVAGTFLDPWGMDNPLIVLT